MAVSYLGEVGERTDGSGFSVTLTDDVAAGTALICTVACYQQSGTSMPDYTATDPSGNTWYQAVSADIGDGGISGVVVAQLACQVEAALSASDVITITQPAGAQANSAAVVIDAFTGVDVTSPDDTAITPGAWGVGAWSTPALSGDGFAYASIGIYMDSNSTPGSGWSSAGTALNTADPRRSQGHWREFTGSTTPSGTLSPTRGAVFAAASYPLASTEAFSTTVWDGLAENPATIAIWDGSQEIPIGVTERVPFDPAPAALPFWGAAVGGNSNPSPLEGPAGRAIGARRTYFNQGTTSSALSMAAGDVAAGRVPWLSFKLSASWEQAANGAADTWAADLGNQLGALGGPVMVTFHHEPEGDEPDEAAFVAMHDRLYTFMQPHGNIRCGPVLTGWTTLYSGNPEYALDTMWPGAFNSGDFLGLDAYNYYGTYSQQGTFNASTGVWSPQPGDTLGSLNPSNFVYLSNQYIQPFASWASSKGVDWAIGEFGFSYDAGQYDLTTNGEITWLRDVWDAAVATGNCLALCYFSSAYHARCDWRVDGDPDRLAAWLEILDESPAPGTGWGQ